MTCLNEFCDILDTYGGRDKVSLSEICCCVLLFVASSKKNILSIFKYYSFKQKCKIIYCYTLYKVYFHFEGSTELAYIAGLRTLLCPKLVLYFFNRSSLYHYIFIQHLIIQYLFYIEYQVLKALCYVAKLTGGLSAGQNAELSQKLLKFSSKISGARTTVRLIDDIPLLQYTLEYGWGRQVNANMIL